MNNPDQIYCAFRFRSTDHMHKKGDVKYMKDKVMYVGQTDECDLQIASHPDYADCCYAVIVKSDEKSGWKIIRQEDTADISVNGVPLLLVSHLHHGDVLKFDQTVVQFTEEQGDLPTVSYIHHHTPWGMWAVMATMFLVIAGIVVFLIEQNKKPTKVFEKEISSICKIEADTVLVLSSTQDTLAVIVPDHVSVGTGFITNEGYFVTARHCVEFWLAMEQELRPNLYDIQSLIVRKAIDAELDSTIRLVSKVRITSHDGKKTWCFSSDDFTMDKSHDDINEYGDFETPYLWRSVISMYEKRDAELGDVAVLKLKGEKGNIILGTQKSQPENSPNLYAFGYPQSENRQTAIFSYIECSVFQYTSPHDCFLCDKEFDFGFSGAPVFTRSNDKFVAGIVSRRTAGEHTLIVPVAQIHSLINKIPKQ